MNLKLGYQVMDTINKDPLISVIVPCYNVEKYLRKCVDSILNQTYRNLEVILVDDGSPDGSPAICDEYAKNESRVVVFHKENGGLSDARNYGIVRAKGEYITFIDSDDFVDKDYVEYMYTLLKKYKTKMSICQHRVCISNGKTIDLNLTGDELISVERCIERMLYHDVIDVSAWAKLYHRSLFSHVHYPKGKVYEDVGTTYAYLMQCEEIAVGYEAKYNYSLRDNSIVTGTFNPSKFDLIEMTDKMAKEVLSVYPNLSDAVLRRRVYARLSTLSQMTGTKDYRDQRNEIVSFIKSNAYSVLKNKNVPRRDKIGILSLTFGYGFYSKCWAFYKLLKNAEWAKVWPLSKFVER